MKGLEGIIQRTRFLPVVGVLACTGPGNQQQEDTQEDSGDTVDEPTHEAPYITSATQATAYVDQAFSYTLTAWQDTTGGQLTCSINALFDFTQTTPCDFTFTPSSVDSEMSPYSVDLDVEDNNGEDEEQLTLTIAEVSGEDVSLSSLSDLSGYTNETLNGNGKYTGDVVSATMTFDSALEKVVRSSTVNYGDGKVKYELAFNNDIDWSDYSSGKVDGTATVKVCDYNNDCATENIDVKGYALTEILITAQTADDKDPLSSASIMIDCESGDSYTLSPNSHGEATAYLNNGEDVCMVTSDAGSSYAIYSWDHEIGSGSEDKVSSGYYEIWAEVYDNFTPSDLEREYGTSDCYDGLLSGSMDNSRMLLMFASGLYDIVDGVYASKQTFERYSEGELSDTIKYFVTDINDEGEVTDVDLYDEMYDAVQEGLGRINNENSLGYTFFEEAVVIDDANVVFRWDTDQTHVSCGYNSDDIIETYATSEYCMIGIHTASSRTVMEEAFNTISEDLCGDSISDGGTSFTTIDNFVWNTIQFAKYQNLMERTY